MQTIAQHNPFAGPITSGRSSTRRAQWAGRVLSGVAVLFLAFDAVAKLSRLQPVIEASQRLLSRRRLHARSAPALVRGGLRHPAHVAAGRHAADGLPW
jgi:hypothetical protein